ncbi:hypothetical protein PV11_03798 [Exophiala sideris]|uniref:Uncharacterized protein n=1 Tax=Exophiala sideris TaxID=1016849 RepID=A0A0D1YFE4_9EURO|nr:hypothetical protein PV11_03798 [Exophiala sideris]
MSENKDHGDIYILARDHDGSTRLTAQHFLMTTRIGGLLMPQLEPTAQKPGVKIADIATGNGIWGAYAAVAYPEAQVIGLDISDQQFPPAWTWPKNLSLDICNILRPLPQKLVGYFDIVNVRLLAPGLSGRKDFMTAIERFSDLLKPGGYLQWRDIHFPAWQTLDESLVIDDKRFSRFAQLLDEVLEGGISNRMFELGDLVTENPTFTEVSTHEPPILPWLLEYETSGAVKTFSEMLATARMTLARSERRKLALADEAQRQMDEYLRRQGLMVLKTKVITAKKAGV